MSIAPLACRRCVVSSAVPDVRIDQEGICSICRDYDTHWPVYNAYFRTEADLHAAMAPGRVEGAEFDCLLLYSGGKDSTYVLYRLIDLGYRVLTLTFDNGYIPAACFDNIRQVCDDVRVENIVARVERANMNQVFAESLAQSSTVCSGCFRALTARSTELAIARRIPAVVTGLSRGQIFETKIYQLMRAGITAADDIDQYLQEFRSCYHGVNDNIARLIDDRAMDDRDGFDRIRFVDFYRYSDVSKREIVATLKARAPFWRKPAAVGGCSTNCLVNDVGIHVHQRRRGYHNYAKPLAWDVRFGHLTRDEALTELDSPLDQHKIESLLKTIGYDAGPPLT